MHSEPRESSTDKDILWEQKLCEMETVADAVGTPIDIGIRETVAVLQLLGLHTLGSCEGHMDHGIAAPWIYFQSRDPRLEEYHQRYGELMASVEELEEYSEKVEKLYDKMNSVRDLIDRIEALEYKKLIPYLDEFYQGQDIYYEERLIIDSRGRLICQGALLQPAEEKETQALRLRAYQQEMRDFTEFLKDKFFG